MDLDQQQLSKVNDENANINKKYKNKNAKGIKQSSKNKRAFGQDLTNKANKAHPIEIIEDVTAKKDQQQKPKIAPKEVHKANELAPWDLRRVDEDEFVTDYVEDIMSSLREDEILNRGGCVIESDFDFMGAQKDLNYRMRAVLVDWLIEVHRKFKLLPSTYFLGVNLLDRYLAKEQLSRKKLQLAGIPFCDLIS